MEPPTSALWRQSLREVEESKLGAPRRRQIAATVSDYVRCCALGGREPFPVSYDTVAEYILAYVRRQSGATHSIKNIKSHLRVHCRVSGKEWLSEGDAAKVKKVEDGLKFEDYSCVRKMEALLRSVLISICELLDLRQPPHLLMATTLFFGHDGLLRGGELWSGIKVTHISWHSDFLGFDLTLWRTKTHRSGGPITITYRTQPGEFGAVPLLKMWFTQQELWDKPDAYLWTGLRQSGDSFLCGPLRSAAANKSMWVRAMRWLLTLVGHPAHRFGGHSCRVGGACDLFNSGVSLAWIMKYGRWKTPEAAMEYFRHNHLMAEEIARVFAAAK